MNIRIEKFVIATDASGDWTETRIIPDGVLIQIRYVVDGGTPLDTGWDLTITGATTGYSYFNATNLGTSSFSASPRVPEVDTANFSSLYAGAGEPVEDHAYIGNEDLVVTVDEGGNDKDGIL